MWLAPKLKHRIEIQRPEQSSNTSGGFDRTYTTLTTVWAGMEERSNLLSFIQGQYIRGVQTGEADTHEFIVRRSAVYFDLNKEFDKSFSSAFDIISDLNPLKSDNFIFLQGNSGSSTSGRRFRINRARVDDNHKEYVKIRTTEIEEVGTGWPDSL